MRSKKNRRELLKRALTIGIVMGVIAGAVVAAILTGFVKGRSVKKAQEELKSLSKELKVLQEAQGNQEESENTSSSVPEEDWRLLLVNERHPLNTSYAPQLAEVMPDRQVDARILEDTQQMLQDAENAGLSVYICSSYRSYDQQRQVFNDTMVSWVGQGYSPLDAYDETKKSVAVPGTSEHATGLALDITSAQFTELDERQAETPEAKWLAENCWKYGFILRYPPDKADITGIIYEPWHYRYVGKEIAKEIMERGITLEEYLGED